MALELKSPEWKNHPTRYCIYRGGLIHQKRQQHPHSSELELLKDLAPAPEGGLPQPSHYLSAQPIIFK